MLSQAFVVLLFILGVQCSINKYPRIPGIFTNQPGVDAGTPLILTDYIEANKTVQGRHLSKVVLPKLNITSYAGYFRVNATADNRSNSSLFFWFFPAQVKNSSAPVLVWLQGGPGASSMFGLFQENGPLVVTKTNGSLSLVKRKIHWALNHNVIYIDNPVGTGFSYAQHSDLYSRNEQQVGVNLYIALRQFFKVFPEYQKNDFYVTGESYAGKYVPALAITIHINNAAAKTKINLKGIAIGNGLCDPLNMMVYSSYLYQIGLVDDNGKKLIEEKEKNIKQLILDLKWDEAYNVFETIQLLFKNMSGFTNHFNYLIPIADNSSDVLMGDLFKTASFRKSIHVGDIAFKSDNTVETFLKEDFMSSVKSWIELLVNATDSKGKKYKILFYNGQLDIIVAYPLTVSFLKTLDWSGKDAYAKVSRNIWYHNNEIAGYVKKVDNFYEVLVRNAGHMVPTDQPEWAFDLITKFTGGTL